MQYAIYFLIIILGILFVNNRLVTGILLVVDWILFAFSRGNADYIEYLRIYNSSKVFFAFNSGAEFGYQILCVLFRDILHMSYNNFRLVISTVALLIVYCTIKRHTKNYAFVMALFTAFPLLISIVQIRNWISFAIIFGSIHYLESERISDNVKFIVCVMAAGTIHITSLFYLLLLLCKIKDEDKLIKGVLAWCITGHFFVLPVGRRIIEMSGHLEIYFSRATKTHTQYLMLAVLVVLFCLSIQSRRCLQEYYQKMYFGKDWPQRANSNMRYADMTVKISIISFIIWPFISYSLEVMRFVRYLMLFEYILVSIPVKLKQNRVYICKALMCTLAFWFLYFFCARKGLFDTVFTAGLEDNSIIQYWFQ